MKRASNTTEEAVNMKFYHLRVFRYDHSVLIPSDLRQPPSGKTYFCVPQNEACLQYSTVMSRRNWMGDKRFGKYWFPLSVPNRGLRSNIFRSGRGRRANKISSSRKPLFELLDVGDDVCQVRYLNTARPARETQTKPNDRGEDSREKQFIYFGPDDAVSRKRSAAPGSSKDLFALETAIVRHPAVQRNTTSEPQRCAPIGRELVREEDIVDGLAELTGAHFRTPAVSRALASIESAQAIEGNAQDSMRFQESSCEDEEASNRGGSRLVQPRLKETPAFPNRRTDETLNFMDDEEDAELRWLKLV